MRFRQQEFTGQRRFISFSRQTLKTMNLNPQIVVFDEVKRSPAPSIVHRQPYQTC